jgi:thiol-disulfide isomerase/thioredoxin
MLEAVSWLGRGALAAKQFDKAEEYAVETYRLAAGKPVDTDRHLATAVGAAIEVRAQVMAQRGERAEAVQYLRGELSRYRATSIRTRIQKNINLLSLEGKPAPPLEALHWLGAKPPTFAELKGKPVLLFFWAHWCGDCKGMTPAINRLMEKGLTVIGPTQRYGYAARGEDATPSQETAYIDRIRKQSYPAGMPVPVSEENFRNYGASTTPTLVLIGRDGKVTLYHPGHMSYEDLARHLRALGFE